MFTKDKKYHIICDGCKKRFHIKSKNLVHLANKAAMEGWLFTVNKDLCRKCGNAVRKALR